MFKKLLCALLSCIALLPTSMLANAQGATAVAQAGEIHVDYVYTRNCVTSLNISDGQAICESTINGYPGTTTKIIMTMYLEKKTLWWWSTQAKWTQTFDSYRGALSKTYSISSGTYRVKAIYTVYSGANSEDVTGYSSEANY